MQPEDQQSISSLVIYLIKVSKYDDDGYVIRHWRGVLPSNSLACLYGLTEDVRRRAGLGADLKWKIEVLDESVHYI
ncbi:MAG: radical SAM protein, partial [Bacteroidota bacterium]